MRETVIDSMNRCTSLKYFPLKLLIKENNIRYLLFSTICSIKRIIKIKIKLPLIAIKIIFSTNKILINISLKFETHIRTVILI